VNVRVDDDARRARSVHGDELPTDPALEDGREALRPSADPARRCSRRLPEERPARAADRRRPAQELELELLVAAQGEDGTAREIVVEACIPMIATMARRYPCDSCPDRDELVGQGVAGLLRALARYDSSEGVPFWAYAAWWVRHSLQQHVSERMRPIVP
jgi:DNA-directed RNA polymerase sigma subunit (sigma70/sigma32)